MFCRVRGDKERKCNILRIECKSKEEGDRAVEICFLCLMMREGKKDMVREESGASQATLEKEDTQTERDWKLLFKFDPTPEELELAAKIFVASCWELSNVEKVRTFHRKPDMYESSGGYEITEEEGDTTWLVTDGERRAWVTRYGLNQVPLWSVNVADEEDC
jgi:hypothetical protein